MRQLLKVSVFLIMISWCSLALLRRSYFGDESGADGRDSAVEARNGSLRVLVIMLNFATSIIQDPARPRVSNNQHNRLD